MQARARPESRAEELNEAADVHLERTVALQAVCLRVVVGADLVQDLQAIAEDAPYDRKAVLDAGVDQLGHYLERLRPHPRDGGAQNAIFDLGWREALGEGRPQNRDVERAPHRAEGDLLRRGVARPEHLAYHRRRSLELRRVQVGLLEQVVARTLGQRDGAFYLVERSVRGRF